MTSPAQPSAELPALPRLTLRVGVAGNRNLDPAMIARIEQRLDEALAAIAAPLASAARNREGRVTRFYCDKRKPLLRLISGLAEGADALCADALSRYAANAGPLDTELAAVLPFALHTYRASRDPVFWPTFDRQAAQCSYILTLDGIYEPPAPGETHLAKRRRSRAYRAQGRFLARHSDLLLVVANPGADGHAGGALETLHEGLAFGLPVLFVDVTNGAIRLIAPEDDAPAVLEADPPKDDAPPVWKDQLARMIDEIIAGPDQRRARDEAAGHPPAKRLALLEEYFLDADVPPMSGSVGGNSGRKHSHRERLWSKWIARLNRAGKDSRVPSPQAHPAAYARWRERARQLNYDAAGLYRGGFLLNYRFAVAAVLLAALSLALIGYAPGHQHFEWIPLVLLGLAIVKLGVVGTIFWNTHQAEHASWNERAIDYRYLAERLRALCYLPGIGSFQPPYVAPPMYASRVVRQSVVDWLADAITRAVSAAEVMSMRHETVRPDGADPYQVRVAAIDVLATTTVVRDAWVAEQSAYHDSNAKTMQRLYAFLDRWGSRLSVGVIAIVGLDIALLFTLYDLNWVYGWVGTESFDFYHRIFGNQG